MNFLSLAVRTKRTGKETGDSGSATIGKGGLLFGRKK